MVGTANTTHEHRRHANKYHGHKHEEDLDAEEKIEIFGSPAVVSDLHHIRTIQRVFREHFDGIRRKRFAREESLRLLEMENARTQADESKTVDDSFFGFTGIAFP